MPDHSDRERLLRLIDGGPDVVKEVQQQRETSAKGGQIASQSQETGGGGPDMLSSFKAWWRKSGLNASAVIKMALAMILLIFAIHSLMGLLKSMGRTEKGTSSAPAVTAAAQGQGRDQDETGIGLRLVGVDWDDPPVALLEDMKTGRTYFAKKNDNIKQARVKQIFKDKVLVSFRGKNVELR